jgi:hypothetical protein
VTILVGVRCTDGVVIGADSVATSAMGPQPLVQLPSNDKIRIFGGRVIVAATGAVGLSQRLMGHVERAIGNKALEKPLHECTGEISARFVGDCNATGVPRHQQVGLQFGALMAAVIQGEPRLIEYGTVDFQGEVKQDQLFFVSMGSGQVLADPFLAFVVRVLWKGTIPTVDQAKFGVYWTLSHTIRFAAGGVGGPIRMAALRKVGTSWSAVKIDDDQEAEQFITDIETHIAEFPRQSLEDAPASDPPPTRQ